MPDDARTRAHEALFSAFGSDGSIMHVSPYEAVDALLAAGWAPPPARILVTLFTARDVVGNASRVPGLDLGYTDNPAARGLANDRGAPLTLNEACRLLNVSEAELRAEAARVGVDLADNGIGRAILIDGRKASEVSGA